MNDEQMRQRVYDAYKSTTWHSKVKKMSQNQVYAVYLRLQEKGKIK